VPYIGRGLTTGAQYQKLDDIAINNATTFTMQVSSVNVSPDQNHLILVVNGVIQEPGTGFTVAGSTCTLASAITTSGHSGTDTIYGVIAGDAAFAAYDSIGVNALGVTAGTVTASRAVVPDSNKDIASFRNVTLTGELDSATLDVSGNADIDGTTNLDAVDIDGAVQIDATFTSGVDGQGYDTKFFGDTSSAYMLWDTSADDLVFAGAAGIDLAGDIDVDGTANLDVVDIDGAVDMASTLTLAGNADFNGDLDVDGTTNLDAVDIDGAVQIDATFTSGVDGQGYDTKFFGDTSGAYIMWDTSADDLIFVGAAGLDIAGDIDIDGTANLDIVDIDGAVNMAADLTSTANIIIDADDKGLTLGADQDVTLFSDGAGSLTIARGTDFTPAADDTEGWIAGQVGDSSSTYFTIVGGEGAESAIYMYADTGDDNDDKYKMETTTGGNFTISSYSTGSWVSGITYDGSSGKVGIGTSTPAVINSWTAASNINVLNVYDADAGARIVAQGNDASLDLIDLNATADEQWFSIYNNGSTVYFRTLEDDGADVNLELMNFNLNTGTTSFGDPAGNQGMTILSNGTITVTHDGNSNELVLRNHDTNTDSNNVMQIWDFAADSDGTGAYYVRMEDSDGEIGSIKISSASGVAFNTSSDYRLKENEVLITDGLEMVNNLKPYRFNFKGHTDLILDGFFAHEVAPFVPTAVDGEKDAMNEDGTIHPQSMDYGQMVTVMVGAIQELSAKVEALENA